jgi:signal transduction histidine kinase
LTQGKRGEQIAVRSGDELGKLTAAFNQMSSDLTRAENARRQMTADVAHDLRTPLTVLSAYIESLGEGVLQPTPERFAVMQTEVNHLSHLVEDLMTLARADAGEVTLKRHPVALADLLNRIAKTYALQAEGAGLTLAHQAEPGLPTLSMDEERMAQVLGNLVSNAIRYTHSGGRVSLAALREGGCIKLIVSDTGKGIAADALPFVFDRFFRADASRSAGDESGLGLAIAKSLVEAHGGRIEVQSQVGVGTTFVISF